MNGTRLLVALLIGLISGTRFSVDPLFSLAVGILVAVPAYLALTVITRVLDETTRNGRGVTDLCWELGFLLSVLVVGSGLGMLMASSLGWSATPHTLRYPFIITVFATASLLIGYRSTAPGGRELNI